MVKDNGDTAYIPNSSNLHPSCDSIGCSNNHIGYHGNAESSSGAQPDKELHPTNHNSDACGNAAVYGADDDGALNACDACEAAVLNASFCV